MPRQRRRVLFSGHVQGVGFRYTTLHVARGFDVTGYVRNLDDGSVEVVAEGQPGELDLFLDAVGQAMKGHIARTESEVIPAGEPPFVQFSIE